MKHPLPHKSPNQHQFWPKFHTLQQNCSYNKFYHPHCTVNRHLPFISLINYVQIFHFYFNFSVFLKRIFTYANRFLRKNSTYNLASPQHKPQKNSTKKIDVFFHFSLWICSFCFPRCLRWFCLLFFCSPKETQLSFFFLNFVLDGPAIVRVNLFVRSIATISDIKMVRNNQIKLHLSNPTNQSLFCFIYLFFCFL